MKAGQRKQWPLAAAILFLTILAYQPVWHAGFIWDDDDHLTANPAMTEPGGLRMIWSSLAVSRYYPLTLTSFWIQRRVWGLNPMPYHLVNIAIHAMNGVLVFLVLRRLRVPGAWLAAALWAVHPVNVESVAWITELKNTQSGLLFFAALLCFLQFEENESPYWYVSALLCGAGAMLSKPSTVVLPVVLLLCAWWRRGNWQRRDFVHTAPFFVLAFAMSVWTIIEQRGHVLREGTSEWSLGVAERFIVAGKDIWFYAGKILWPVDLAFVYPRWETAVNSVASWLPLIGVMVAGTTLWRRRQQPWARAGLLAGGYFITALLPVLGFLDVYYFRYTFMADHFQYLASLGIVAWVAAGVARHPWSLKPAGTAVCAVLVATLGILTWEQGHVYRNAETVWQDTLAKNPNAWMAHNNLGTALLRSGKTAEAMSHFEEALRIHPDYPEALCNRGVVLQKLGKLTEAKEQYAEALRAKPDYAEAHYDLGSTLFVLGKIPEAIQEYEQAIRLRPDYGAAQSNLGLALARVGKAKEAIEHYEQALRFEPDSAAVHYNLGVSLVQAGRLSEAIGAFEQAVRSKPDDAEIHYTLGSAFARLGRLPEAITEWERAVRLKPDFAQAHSDLGLALEQTGKATEAIGQLEQALRIKPDYPGIQNNLAWLLATVPHADGGDPARAVTLAQRACELGSNRDPACLDTLGVAYASAGRFDDAIATAQKALEFARSASQPELVRGIGTRLEMYRRGQTYHESTNAPTSGNP